MKQKNMRKDYPFEQTGAQSREEESKQSKISVHALSEMMNPTNMNYFGAAYSFADL